jgi:CHAT domain-containing protein
MTGWARTFRFLFLRRETIEGAAAPRSRTPRIRLATVGGLLASAIGVLLVVRLPWAGWLDGWRRTQALSSLVEAVGDRRFAEPRLTGGFRHGSLSSVTRSESGEKPNVAESPRVLAAAAQLQESAERDPTPEALGALGVVHLVRGKVDEAIEALEEASQGAPQNPRLWTDLSAAELVRGEREGHRADLARGLDAAARAVQLEPSSAEAHFNRALALERLGLREQSRRAWEEYHRVDTNAGWADEGRRHASALGGSQPDFQQLRKQVLDDMASGDPSRARRVAEGYPTPAREVFVEELLPKWADAVLAGRDATAAVAALRVGSQALFDASGDPFERDIVTGLEGAQAQAQGVASERLRQLARGFASYKEGAGHFRTQRFDEGRRSFLSARELLEAAASPAWGLAAYRLAVASYYRHENPKLSTILSALEPWAREKRYWHVLGITLGLRALAESTRAELTRSLETYREALGCFETARSLEHVADIHDAIAENLDRLGESQAAWEERHAALSRLDIVRTPRNRGKILAEAVEAALDQQIPWAAAQFQDALLETTKAWSAPSALAEGYVQLALVLNRLEAEEAGAAALAVARGLIRDIADRDVASMLTAETLSAEGRLYAAKRPDLAVDSLSRAIEYFRQHGQHPFLGPLYLALARAYLAQGRDELAEPALLAAIDAFEEQRSGLQGNQSRISFFEQANDVFDEMVELQLRHGKTKAALTFLERGRARQLLDAVASIGRTDPASVDSGADRDPANLGQQLPRGTTLVYYALLAHRAAAWVLDREQCTFVPLSVSSAELRLLVTRLGRAIVQRSSRRDVDEMMTALHGALIRPLRSSLRPGDRLAFVPDDVLELVPFAALRDRDTGHRLVEDHTISLAPSGAFLVHASLRTPARQPLTALVVGNPTLDPRTNPVLPPLTQAEGEAGEIAALYESAELLVGSAPTKGRFLASAGRHDVIHFGGHAVANTEHPALSRLLLAPEPSQTGSADLFMQDLSSVDLSRVRLVVLAACRTGGGRAYRREGTLSLAYAFLAAGVPAVVATLWDVEDQAARSFAVSFHRAYHASGDAFAALREAQLSRLDPANDQRLAWSAFEVIGSGEGRTLQRE